MAKKGLSTFLYAPLDESTLTYGKVKKLAAAISYKESLTKNSVTVYADNIKQFEDNSVTGGNVALEILDDDPKIFTPLLGRKKKKIGDHEVNVGNTEDMPIPVGFGLIENERVGTTVAYYRVKFYPKVTFAPYDTEAQTGKDTPDYKNPTVTGSIYCLENGDYIIEDRYSTMEEAIKVLYAMFGATPPDFGSEPEDDVQIKDDDQTE
ncbi:MAG: hypothetical protein HDQ97_19205 [Lachnospiraceae bacterium]|nr:hypothetical protein [Lachnospiraceae bacterium]